MAKQALLVLRAKQAELDSVKAELSAERQSRTEPIAVIGMGCRFPGSSGDPETFWRALAAGVDAVTQVPADRWPVEDDPGGDPDRRAVRWGAFLADVHGFDAGFFGISPREAEKLDPQQRLLLEVAWEALENAGIVPDQLLGTRTGVFVGITTNDYASLCAALPPAQQDIYMATGNGHCFPPGRLAYTLGLQGPALAVDTACSSSLVAVHLASQALRNGDCGMALVGGVNLMLSPSTTALFAQTHALSPEGRCKTFDASANGFVRGEGCGIVVLKRLSDAQRDGDPILALIRGSAVNQDGRSTGLTAPNVLAQQAMLRQALESAGVGPGDIGYVECHGTGTSLGDPIEVEALAEVLGKGRDRGAACVLGALKTNIGHLEAAAGIAGLIKAVLALGHEAIPGNLHFKTLNPRIPLAQTPFAVPTRTVPWPRGDKRRLAGVSAFALSGTNAHVVLEEAPAAEVAPQAPKRSAELMVLSARSPAALDAQATRLRDHLGAHPALSLGDLAFSLATTRSAMDHRLAVAATTREGLLAALAAAAAGQTPAGAVRGRVSTGGTPKIVFVFPGQGSQWLGMGRQLLTEEPVFRAVLEECDRAIHAEAGWSLLTELSAGEATSQLGRIDVVQPALFAIEVALAALWRSWGVTPDAVVGHSMGEVAAAHVAGALSLADAVAIICRRSRLLRRISGQGEMAVVELSFSDANAALSGYEDRLSVAVSNSPQSTVLSGQPSALSEVLASLEAKGVFCRRVKVDVASHSPQVDPLRGDLTAALRGLEPRAAAVPMRSTVTGAVVAGPELGAGYWADNLRQPVRFAQAIQALLEDGHGLFVEMSPHPILTTSVEEVRRAARREGAVVGSLRRGQDERPALLEALGALWVQGYLAAWERLFPAGGRRVPLPTYPWQRERYWIEAPPEAASGDRRRAHEGGHPLIGRGMTLSTDAGTRVWETTLDQDRLPWLGDHRVQGAVWLPGAAYLEMALASAAEVFGRAPLRLTEVVFARPMAFPPNVAVTVQLVTNEESAGRLHFQIASRVPGLDHASWTTHVRGTLERTERADAPATLDLAALRASLGPAAPAQSTYAAMAARGLDFGPAFRGVDELRRGDGVALGRVRLPDAAGSASPYQVHPALLDACLQVVAGTMDVDDATPWVLAEVGSLRLHQPPSGELWCHARFTPPDSPDRRCADALVVDAAGAPVIELGGLTAQRLDRDVGTERVVRDWLYEPVWRSQPNGSAPRSMTAGERWLILADAGGAGSALARALEARGASCLQAWAGERREARPDGSWMVRPSEREDLDALLAAASRTGGLTGIVSFWGLDAPETSALTTESLMESQRRVCGGALHLLQALFRPAATPDAEPPQLFVVTRGATPAAGSALNVAQACLWGLGKVAALEHPELRVRQLDLDPADTSAPGELLLPELLSNTPESQVAWRGSERYVPRLVRVRVPEAPSAPEFRADACYLITGGLGNLGLGLAAWLVERGARHLVLTGRRGAEGSEAQGAVEALRQRGVEVLIQKADVADPEQAKQLFAAIEAQGVPLRGVFHAAWVQRLVPLVEEEAESLLAALRPKVAGAWLLHTLSATHPLDFFVSYSSVSALWGISGGGAYVAANTFLAALAHARARNGRVAQTIDFGVVRGGMATEEVVRSAEQQGIPPMPMAQVNAGLRLVLSSGRAEIALAHVDWPRFRAVYEARGRRPLLEELGGDNQEAPRVAEAGSLFQRLDQTPGDARRGLVIQLLGGVASRILRLAPDRLDPHVPLTAYGLDSLMSVEVRNALKSLGVTVSGAKLLKGASLEELTQEILGEHEAGQRGEGLHPAPSPDVAAVASNPAPPPVEPASRLPDAPVVTAGGWLLIPTPRPDARFRLFCFPYAGGGPGLFQRWGAALPPEVELCAVTLPGRAHRLGERPLTQMGELVEQLVPALEPWLDRPFALFGHCLGGVQMYEVAWAIRARSGRLPIHVFVSGARAPSSYTPEQLRLDTLQFGPELPASEQRVSDAQALDMMASINFPISSVLFDDAETRAIMLPILRADLEMNFTYGFDFSRPEPRLPVPATVMGGRVDPFVPRPHLEKWKELVTGSFELLMRPGDHYFIHREEPQWLRILKEKALDWSRA